jgi:sensor domain CHASE-containing protein
MATLIAFALLSCMAWAYLHYLESSKQQIGRSHAQAFALRISQRTNESVSPVYMLASIVKLNRGKVPDFEKVAMDLLDEFPLVRAVELAPAGVVSQVYPLQGNESIVGHDLLKDRERNREAHIALAKRQMMLAGPFELIQGGLGAVARYPVFLPSSPGRTSFWGFTIVVMRIKELLISAGQMELERKGFNFQICRVIHDVENGDCKVFMQSSPEDLPDPLSVMVELPNNQWKISVMPVGGWISQREWMATVALVLGGALLAGLIQFVRLDKYRLATGDSSDSGSR